MQGSGSGGGRGFGWSGAAGLGVIARGLGALGGVAGAAVAEFGRTLKALPAGVAGQARAFYEAN